MDDLVQRLRAYPATEKTYRDGVFFAGMGKTIQHEAADAIERLTRERDEAREQLRKYDEDSVAVGNGLKALHDLLSATTNQRDEARAALRTAEAALADIGDADREDGDDVAWCERRAAQALPVVRAVLGDD